MVVTAKMGWMEWHFRCGYLILSLLLFRIVWGLIGGYWARFSSFVPSPRGLLAYLRGESPAAVEVGHNPLGALSVLAMLVALSLQILSGLGADDEISASGPLARHIASEWVSFASFYHTKVGKLLLVALIVLHVAAIVRYRVKGHNLVKPMVWGDKELDFPAEASRDDWVQRFTAFALFSACAYAVFFFVRALG
jgi:cytochrome b